MLTLANGDSFAQSVVSYQDTVPGWNDQGRIWLEITDLDENQAVPALVDTGADWSLLGAGAWDVLGLPAGSPLQTIPMSTRLGTVTVELFRVRVRLRANQGPGLEMEATLGRSAQWSGPSILGYQGLLDRLRFAVDPASRQFYF